MFASMYVAALSLACLALGSGWQDGGADALGAEPPAISGGAEVDAVSRYVWRGLEWNNGPAVQPSAWASAAGFTATVWYSVNLKDDGRGRFKELDTLLAYSFELGSLEIEPAFNLYWYFQQVDEPHTGEAALTLAWGLGPLELFTRHSFDLVEYRGAWFGELGLRTSMPLAARLVLEGSALAGFGSRTFNQIYIEAGGTTLDLAALDLALQWRPVAGLYLRPHLSLSTLVAPSLRRAVRHPMLACAGLVVGLDTGEEP